MSASAGNAVTAGTGDRLAAPAGSIYRYGKVVNSHDLMKVFAICVMVVDHTGHFFVDDNLWFRVVGRMAAPLFFFLVGYSGSYRFKLQVLLLGIALWIINFLTNTSPSMIEHAIPVNILISFVLIKALMGKFDFARMSTESLVLILAALMLVSIPTYVVVEYGSLGLCYAIGARLLHQRHPLGRFWMATTVGVHFIFEMVALLIWNSAVPVHILPVAIPMLAILLLVNLTLFINYGLRTFTVQPRWVRTPLIYASRYSLQIYFFHLAAFMIVYRLT